MQVLVIEPHSLPLVDPDELFEDEGFQKHGTLFWPGLFSRGMDREVGMSVRAYTLFGLRPPWQGLPEGKDYRSSEFGQLLIDRSAQLASTDRGVFGLYIQLLFFREE